MGDIKCPSCGNSFPMTSVACPLCGRTLPLNPSSPVRCKKCDAPVHPTTWLETVGLCAACNAAEGEESGDMCRACGKPRGNAEAKRIDHSGDMLNLHYGLCSACSASKRRKSRPTRIAATVLVALLAPIALLLLIPDSAEIDTRVGRISWVELVVTAWYAWCIFYGWRYLRDR